MLSIFKRSLTIVLILFGSTSLANARSGAAQQSTTTIPGTLSWTWIQDSPVIFCGQMGSISSCTIGAAQIAPTTAGSVWVIDIQTINNVTITSVTGGGGTWIKCPNCHASDNAGNNVDAIYNLTGNAGTTQNITINLSGPSGNAFNVDLVEFLPPVGTAGLA
jgi:phage tail sheath gpL-like